MDTMKGGLSLLPRVLNFSAYGVIMKDKEFLNSMAVSVLRVIVGTPLSVLFTSMLAYVLTKKELVAYKFWRKNLSLQCILERNNSDIYGI